jgi:soluble cytochrome b562
MAGNSSFYQYRINQLKTEIAEARKKLEQAWSVSGATDPEVLAFGEAFDKLINEYDRLIKSEI